VRRQFIGFLWVCGGIATSAADDLYDAIVDGRVAIVEEYLAKGGDPNAEVEQTESSVVGRITMRAPLLFWALAARNDHIAAMLLLHGAETEAVERVLEPTASVLGRPASVGLRNTVRSLLQSDPQSMVASRGTAPLVVASSEGQLTVVEDMLEVADRTGIALDGMLDQALYEAIYADHDAIAALLLDAGANPLVENALGVAVFRRNAETVDRLLRAGAASAATHRDANGTRLLDVTIAVLGRNGRSPEMDRIVRAVFNATPEPCASPQFFSLVDDLATTIEYLNELLPECNWQAVLDRYLIEADGVDPTETSDAVP